MLKIYGRKNSVNVQKVMWLIGELKIEYERIDAGGEFGKVNEDWYLALNPMGRVPLLEDGDYVLWESHTIVRYLASQYSSGNLWATDPKLRAETEKWMDWKQSFLQPAMHEAFWGLIRTPREQRNIEAIALSAKQSGILFSLLNTHLHKRAFMTGNEFSIADIPVGAAAYRWYGLEIERPNLQNLRTWYDQLCQRPAFREHVMIPIT